MKSTVRPRRSRSLSIKLQLKLTARRTHSISRAAHRCLISAYTVIAQRRRSIPARVTSPDPKRLLLKSYGFGPQGAEKRLEMMVSQANFEFETPAGVTLRGADDCSPLSLDTGSSGAKVVFRCRSRRESNHSVRLLQSRRAMRTTRKRASKNLTRLSIPKSVFWETTTRHPGTVETPSFLDTADKARAYLNSLQAKAQTTGRYFNLAAGPRQSTIQSIIRSSRLLMVIARLRSGSGFLVVTGTLTMRGNTNFKGVILVLGKGVLIRNGGGNGDIFGGITIAAFDRTAGDFTAPTVPYKRWW